MAMKWTGIGTITGKLAQAQRGMRAGTVEIAQRHAGRWREAMRAGAPWQDQSGEAREGLFAEAAVTGGVTQLTGGHSAPHGPFLELGTVHMTPRAIVRPTADVTAREVSEDFIRLANRFGL